MRPPSIGIPGRQLRLGRLALYTLLVVVPVVMGFLLGHGQLLVSLGAAGIALSSYLSWRWPLVSSGAVLLMVGGYTVFQMVPGFVPDAFDVGGGVRLQDVVLVGMVVAAVLRLTDGNSRRRVAGLLAPIIGVTLWLCFAVFRNFADVGLSALGELRFRYLLLAVPLCLLVSPMVRRRPRAALVLFNLVAVALPVVLCPLVLYLKGWSFGWDSRLFPSQVSVGILLGLVSLWQCRSWIRMPRVVLCVVTGLGGLEIVIDAHRSVWLAAAAALIVLAMSKHGWVARIRMIAGLVVAGIAATLVSYFTKLDLWGIIVERGEAALAGQDTARWRILVWQSTLEQFYSSPVAGRGLGRYWSAYVEEIGGEVTTSPHSLYVMILAHLGVIGMVLFVWLWVAGWRILMRSRNCDQPSSGFGGRPSELAWLGMAALAASAAYGIAYGFEPYSLTLAGICLAGVLGSNSSKTAWRSADGSFAGCSANLRT